ncbi:HEPN domain-containing protein [Methanolobus bombayensis]|uniref:ApeA N-terminal domain 1-containing protein n=1 Tax=Methanolobus bombayensis TaxID=38023 RepID=UPI001AE2329A|nr:HEPN domain-containing protein [Methanolobus bombayensis]MBP1908435.1 hypothetical protein [Methanolobus bombayensis]
MDSFEMKGTWWLPTKEEDKVSGILQFNSSDGGSLELIGSFQYETKILNSQNALVNHDIILGLVGGRKVTCYKCLHIEQSDNATFKVLFIFDGYHFFEEEDICFDEILVSYSNLDYWLSEFPSFFNDFFRKNNDGKASISLNCDLERKKEKLYESSELTLSLISKLLIKPSTRSLLLKQDSYFEFALNEAVHFNYLMEGVLFDLRNFLSLALDIPVYPISITGKKKNHKITHFETKKDIYLDIKVFYETNPTLEKVKDSNILFTYKDLKDKSNLCFSSWFRISKELKPIINLYCGNLYSSEMYLEFKFLGLAQAIESYHRKCFRGTYLESAEEFQEIYFILSESIRQNVEEPVTNTFINKLGYLNQHTFKKRIRTILSCLNDKDLLKWKSKERDSFAQYIGNHRDTFTHYENIDYTSLNYHELSDYVDEMKKVVAMCLVYEIFKDDGS